MPGSRPTGLPAHLLGSGDGHRCVPRPLSKEIAKSSRLKCAPLVTGVNVVRPRSAAGAPR
jgi:hypothetical protein